MPQTVDAHHGELIEETGIKVSSGAAPTQAGELFYYNGKWLAYDAIGAFDVRALRSLIHFIDNGPATGFASGAYREILPAADPFPTSAVWYDSAGPGKKKIVEKLITYTGPLPTSVTWNMYDSDGVTVLATITDTFSYSGPFETSRTRTIG